MTAQVYAYSFGATLAKLVQLSGGREVFGNDLINHITTQAHKLFSPSEVEQYDRAISTVGFGDVAYSGSLGKPDDIQKADYFYEQAHLVRPGVAPGGTVQRWYYANYKRVARELSLEIKLPAWA